MYSNWNFLLQGAVPQIFFKVCYYLLGMLDVLFVAFLLNVLRIRMQKQSQVGKPIYV